MRLQNDDQKVSLESTAHPEPPRPAPADIAPVTPMKQMRDALASPQTEEIRREKIPTSLESISSSPSSTTGASSTETTSLIMDMILEAVRVIHQFSKYPHGVPREVHSRILQTLQKDHQEATGASNLNQWSDGSMWMRVLDMGSSENQKVTIRVVGRCGRHGLVSNMDGTVEIIYCPSPLKSRAEPGSKNIQRGSSIRMVGRRDRHGLVGNLDGTVKIVHRSSLLKSIPVCW
jgi:hypothetical protein